MAELDDMAQALAQISGDLATVQRHRDYYEGKHRLAFATDKYRTAFGRLFTAFADNLCGSVVNTLADRLQLTGFGTTDGAVAAWDLWKAARLKRIAGQTHKEAFITGNSYLIVWPSVTDPRRPIFYINKAEHMTVYYDPDAPGAILWAAKLWMQLDGTARLTLYYPDRIAKYVTRGKVSADTPKAKQFIPYSEEGQPWPLPNPHGRVPVFHFANDAGIGEPGRSELCDVIPLQDALNKVVTDLLVAMEFVALPQRYATGVEFDTDPQTKEPVIPWRAGYDRIWASADPAAGFGEFAGADLRQFIDVRQAFAIDIARVSSTPMHYIIPPASTPPSGEALKTAEQPLSAKADDRTEVFGETWVDVMVFALGIAGNTVAPDDLAPDWADTRPHSDKEAAETAAVKKGLGVPLRPLLRELGYTEPEIADMLAAEATDQQSATDLVLQRVRADQLAAQSAAGVARSTALGDTGPVTQQ